MASLDIGIDLGTCTTVAAGRDGEIIREPSILAIRTKTGEILDVGENVYHMLGRTHNNIRIVKPIADGVVSDYRMTEALIRHMLGKICKNQLIKPRVIVCVPSVITSVESQSVIDATVAAGARQVYLIEEPVAAAIGAGIDISRPEGNLIVDIGGGTCDIAVLSLGGVVCKHSMRVAGSAFDNTIIRHMRTEHNMLVGEKTAEATKFAVGSVWHGSEDLVYDVKGRNLLTGLPTKVAISRSELMGGLSEVAMQIAQAVQSVLERTPPELVGDIKSNGLVLTGGSALINGMDNLLTKAIGVNAYLASDAVDCVAKGTVKSFGFLGTLFDGFVHPATHVH